MLDPIHHQGIRIATGEFRTSPAQSLYVEANEPSLYNIREILSLQYTLKLKANPLNLTYQDTFHPKFTNTFENKPNAIPTFGIRTQQLLNNIDLDVNHITCGNQTSVFQRKISGNIQFPVVELPFKVEKRV